MTKVFEYSKRASAYFNGDFYGFVPHSGYRRTVIDFEEYSAYLAPNALDENLGAAVLQAISHSRFIRPEEQEIFKIFFDHTRISLNYEKWVTYLMEQYKYKSKKSLFKNMMSCIISSIPSNIEIFPTIHEQLEGWTRFPRDRMNTSVVIPIDSTPEIIGRALRTAFERCE